MATQRPLTTACLLLGLAACSLAMAPRAAAAIYPVNKCVSVKQAEAGKYCRRVLKAWRNWEKRQNAAKRDAAIQRAARIFERRWAKAERKALAKGTDCADTTLAVADAESQIDAAINDIVTAINNGLDLSKGKDATCGHKLINAAAIKCGDLLKAESKFIRRPDKDPTRSALGAARSRASDKFSRVWDKGIGHGCPTTATKNDIESRIDAIAQAIVDNTVVSPNVDDRQFTTISPTGTVKYEGRRITPGCAFGTPYHFFAKRGSVNKLVMYYQGGGACWEQLTCSVPTCDTSVDPAGSDNPNSWSTGFADLSNPQNPFRDWNIVFVAYCSCDVHFGDAAQDYDNANPASPLHVEHRGFANARIAEKWAREHFLDPEVVFVTGSSAGAYGAFFNAPLLERVWPAADFQVLADAGNGVITTEFLQNEFAHWNFLANLPEDIPGVKESITEGTGMVGYTEAVASFFPETRWAHYTTAFDGGAGGQTGFYNVMLNNNNPFAALTWWEGSCAFNQVMRQQAYETAAAVPDNYRYYIGTGSRHTMWGSDKVYTDTTGGVPTIVSWVNAMLAGSPSWVNVEASPENVLLAGDPQPPVIPTPPFEQSGSDIVVNCPSSPSGAFLDAASGVLD